MPRGLHATFCRVFCSLFEKRSQSSMQVFKIQRDALSKTHQDLLLSVLRKRRLRDNTQCMLRASLRENFP